MEIPGFEEEADARLFAIESLLANVIADMAVTFPQGDCAGLLDAVEGQPTRQINTNERNPAVMRDHFRASLLRLAEAERARSISANPARE